MVDYALHRIRIEQLVKQSKDQALKNQHIEAAETMLEIMAEAKLAHNAFKELAANARH